MSASCPFQRFAAVIANVAKLIALNRSVAKTAVAETAQLTQAALSVKDGQQLITLQ
jgi:hypothetical protein